MTNDASNGWEAIASEFMACRSDIGADVIATWASFFSAGAAVIDVGAGFGKPAGGILEQRGLSVFAIDASPTLLAAYERQFPNAKTACEPVEASTFFGRQFDGVLMVGLIFLLPSVVQVRVINRLANALVPGGRLLFSAPKQVCAWQDLLTDRTSRSVGTTAYREHLVKAGFDRIEMYEDDHGNNYFDATMQC